MTTGKDFPATEQGEPRGAGRRALRTAYLELMKVPSHLSRSKAAPPKGVPFVVWSDLANGNGGSSNGSAGGASYEGRHSASDGHRIEFRATTTDGNLGVLRLLELITIWQRERFFWFRRVTTREDRREECLGPLAHRLL